MKKLHSLNIRKVLFAATIAFAGLATVSFSSPLAAEIAAPKVGIVNFKRCVEESKVGNAERENFDEMRRQMESALEEKEGQLQTITKKFNDPDYVDSLSPEAEMKAKQEYQELTQGIAQLQQQYYQMLNQANFKVIQNLSDQVADAAKAVAGQQNLTLVLNEESSFYYADALDISTAVISIMDKTFESASTDAAAPGKKA